MSLKILTAAKISNEPKQSEMIEKFVAKATTKFLLEILKSAKTTQKSLKKKLFPRNHEPCCCARLAADHFVSIVGDDKRQLRVQLSSITLKVINFSIA